MCWRTRTGRVSDCGRAGRGALPPEWEPAGRGRRVPAVVFGPWRYSLLEGVHTAQALCRGAREVLAVVAVPMSEVVKISNKWGSRNFSHSCIQNMHDFTLRISHIN